MKRFLLPAVAALVACSTAQPPAPVVEPAPSVASLDELEQEYLSGIEDVKRTVDSYESRKDEIVARKIEDLERLRGLQSVRLGEIEAQRKKIALIEEQLADRRRRLAALGEETGETRETDDPLRRDLEQEAAGLERQIERESKELDERLAAADKAAEEIRRLENADREALFLEELQPLYRKGIELHLGFYRGVIDLARQQLAPDAEASVLVDHFASRIAERNRLLGHELRPEAFATLRHEFELDRRMSQAWLAALILEVRFSLNEFRLETISDSERAELQLLAESLEDSWAANPRLVMYIDGHADSKQFRGRSACVSATKNRELSRQRAEAVRDFFRQRLDGDPERIHLDWFGNFSPQVGERTDELENRRIELRIASRRRDGGFDSNRDYFAMRRGLEMAGRVFLRAEGEWIEASCDGRDVAAEVEYLSAEYRALVERSGLDGAATKVGLGADGRELEVRLGNAFVVVDGGRCVAVRPCPDPSP